MDHKKEDDNLGVCIDVTPETTILENNSSSVVTEPVVTTEENLTPTTVVESALEEKVPDHRSFNLKAYVAVVFIILIVSTGLIFVLEKEGRISTGLFAGLISSIENKVPAARIDGVVISKTDFNSSLKQLNEMAVAQGADITDAVILEKNRTQAIETLVNAELLRQAAVKEGISVTAEEIEGRFTEIQEGIGGAEKLTARMAEFGVTEANLRRDIENEFLIQGLFDVKISTDSIVVSEDEISAIYEQAGGVAGGLPPLEEVREQIVSQINFEKEQGLINEYLETLRQDAEIEILI